MTKDKKAQHTLANSFASPPPELIVACDRGVVQAGDSTEGKSIRTRHFQGQAL